MSNWDERGQRYTMRRPIVIYPDDILVTPSIPITKYTPQIYDLMVDMEDTLRGTSGVALAAVQIGVPLALFVMYDDAGIMQYYINPVIVEQADRVARMEACLSIPGVEIEMMRYGTVTIAYNREEFFKTGKVEVETFKGSLRAQAVQHEIGHINGHLIYEYADKATQKRMNNKCQKYKKAGWITPPNARHFSDVYVQSLMNQQRGSAE